MTDTAGTYRDRLRGQLDELPLTLAHFDAVDKLVRAGDALDEALRDTVRRLGDTGDVDLAMTLERGLDSLHAYCTNAGVDGLAGARVWLRAARELMALDEPVPDGAVELDAGKLGDRATLPWRFLQ